MRAIDLVTRLFQPAPPLVVQVARAELGQCENPTDSNLTKYGDWYDNGPWKDTCHEPYTYNGDKWCATFVVWCFAQSGVMLPPMQHEDYPGAASVASLIDGFEEEGWLVHEPAPGCVGFLEGHVGIIERRDGDLLTMVEGNTQRCDQSGAYWVWRHTRPMSRFVGYGRVGG